MTTWFITGCSTGLGRSLADAVLKAGHDAAVTARDPDTIADLVAAYPDHAIALPLGVTDKASIASAVAATEQRFSGIDVLVNNAGYGYRAAVEEADDAEVAKQFATNVFGPIAVMQAALPGMRARGTGTVVNVSSIATQLAMPGSGFYSASKAAQEMVSEALRREVEPLGLRVLIVEPGAFRTDFAGRSLRGSHTGIDAYDQTVGSRRKGSDQSDGTQLGDPDRAAGVIIETVKAGKMPARLLLGSDAVSIVGKEVRSQLDEIEAWRDTSVTTDFGDAE